MLQNQFSIEMLPPQAVLLTDDIVLICLTGDAHPGSQRFYEGRVPYGTVDVQTASCPIQLAVCRITESERTEYISEYSDEVEAMLAGFPSIISDDIAQIALSLDKTSQIRLLNFLLGFCCKAFDLAADRNFARNCLSLLTLCSAPEKRIKVIATVSDRWAVVQDLSADFGTSLWSISPKQVRRLSIFSVMAAQQISVMERVSADALVVAIGDKPKAWKVDPITTSVEDLLQSRQDRNGLKTATIRVLVPHCEKVAALLREQALLYPAKPIRHLDFSRPLAGALEAAMSTGTGKMFLRGWFFDPHSLIASLELVGVSGSTQIEWGNFHRFFRPDLEKQVAGSASPKRGAKLGFVALVDDPSAGLSLQPSLRLLHKSGACTVLRPALQAPTDAEALTAVLTSIHAQEATDKIFSECIAPAAKAFHERCLADHGEPEIIQIGPAVINPHVSIVIPLFRNLKFIKHQIIAFANDQSIANSQLIYVLDSPEQRNEVEHILRGLYMMTDISIVLVIMSRNLGYAAANNAGAAATTGKLLLLLNSDVIPEKSGWLDELRRVLIDPDVGAVGPKLLFEDGSIQHAGLYFKRDQNNIWLNNHFFKGMPRHWPLANQCREVPGVTGAAILVRSKDYLDVGGICDDFIIGDYEDSDFCLKIRSLGKKVVYVPTAELYHFERRSIDLHSTYSGTLAGKYNQELHHARWDYTIGALDASQMSKNFGAEAI